MMRTVPLRRATLARFAILASLAFAAPLAFVGCAVLGVAANAMPKPPVKPKVVLAGQSVGIMVWTDRGLRAAWPNVQSDLGGGVQFRLTDTIAKDPKNKELAGVTFPYPAASFVRWLRDRPEAEFEPIANVAPRLHVQRLIYVELNSLETRSSNAMALFRGSADATVKCFAIDDPAKPATLLYEERIKVTYPKTSTDDGRPDSTDQKMYVGTLTALADELAKRFIEHPAED
ncbi:hypothetical protein EON77_16405 [bacterium]|nr:MAG: hypothetical protein EON77_16405 [bacterium]